MRGSVFSAQGDASGELGLRPAWSLDLTTVDPDDGMPWDFTVAAKRRKVAELINRDRPLLLITCPMCGPFSSRKNLKYEKMDAAAAKEKLRRLFLFEHPTSASSWSTLQQVMNLEGVYASRFDFC